MMASDRNSGSHCPAGNLTAVVEPPRSRVLVALAKLLMLTIRNSPLFSLRPLRRIRWALYRYTYAAPGLHVDEGVVISSAHRNADAGLRCLGRVNIGRQVYIDCSGGVVIGEDVAISDGAKIFTHNHSVHGPHQDWHSNPTTFSELIIGRFCWIGAGAIVLPSVTRLGEGSIVAAGAVVTKNTEPFAIYGGNPAKKVGIRRISD